MRFLKNEKIDLAQISFPRKLRSYKVFSKTFIIAESKEFSFVGYHATSRENAEKILEEGFNVQLSDEMFFGKGLYLSKNIEDAKFYKERWKKAGKEAVILEVRLSENIDWCSVSQIEGMGTLEQYIKAKKKESLSWYEEQIEERIIDNKLSNFPKIKFDYNELEDTEPFEESEKYGKEDMIFYEDIIDYIKDKHHTLEDFEEGDIIERISQYYWYYLSEIKIKDTDYENYDYDQEKVNLMTQNIKENSFKYPPIIFDPLNKTVIDGIHRIRALKGLGVEKVKAYIGSINDINEEFRTEEDLVAIMGRITKREEREVFYEFLTGFGEFRLDEDLLDEYFTQEYYAIAEDYGECDVEIAPTQIIVHNEEIIKKLKIKIIDG